MFRSFSNFVKTTVKTSKQRKFDKMLTSFSFAQARKTAHVGQVRAGQEVRKWLGRKCERAPAREKGFNAYCHAR